jgi:hypothetical protein
MYTLYYYEIIFKIFYIFLFTRHFPEPDKVPISQIYITMYYIKLVRF